MKLRLSFWQGVFYLLLATGLVLTVIRFTRGLGAVTNLSDAYPWGLWVGFMLGWFFAFARNFAIAVARIFFRAKAELAANRGFLDHI